MPEHQPRTTQTQETGGTTSSETSGQTTDALQDTVGNQAINAMLENQQGTSQELSTGGAWAMAAAGPDMQEEMEPPVLAAGTEIVLTADDVAGSQQEAWRRIARDHGMHEEHLMAFNQHVAAVDQGQGVEHPEPTVPELVAGGRLYMPSTEEIYFAQIRHRAGDMAAAVELFNQGKEGGALAILETARERASGKVGLGYGTTGDDGKFYSQNPELAGASKRRTEEINGQTEYRVNWGADFWKCSLYMHDVVYSAGFKPDQTANDHYRLAGHLQWSKQYQEVGMAQAAPGMCWQRYGGTRSDESHNAILSSFVGVEEDEDDQWEVWKFSIIGAEEERAAESKRTVRIMKGTNEDSNGRNHRFYVPKEQR